MSEAMTTPHFIVEHRITLTLPGILPFLQLFKEQVMDAQDAIAQTINEATAKLELVTTQLVKVGTESSATLQKVSDLETVVASMGGSVSPALQAAVDALKLQAQKTQDAAQAVDALVPDAPAAA